MQEMMLCYHHTQIQTVFRHEEKPRQTKVADGREKGQRRQKGRCMMKTPHDTSEDHQIKRSQGQDINLKYIKFSAFNMWPNRLPNNYFWH